MTFKLTKPAAVASTSSATRWVEVIEPLEMVIDPPHAVIDPPHAVIDPPHTVIEPVEMTFKFTKPVAVASTSSATRWVEVIEPVEMTFKFTKPVAVTSTGSATRWVEVIDPPHTVIEPVEMTLLPFRHCALDAQSPVAFLGMLTFVSMTV